MQEYTVRVYTSEDGTIPRTEWHQNGQLHRTDGPAVEYADGDKAWFIEGKLHRLDGPAVEYADGYKAWWVEGKLHRSDGPAIEYANGNKLWCIEDNRYTEEEFKQKTTPACTKTVMIDGVEYHLVKK